MPTNKVKCVNCGLRGEIEVPGLKSKMPASLLFRHLGHTPFWGYMRYLCPDCAIINTISPYDLLGEGVVTGLYYQQDESLSDSRPLPVRGKNAMAERDKFYFDSPEK